MTDSSALEGMITWSSIVELSPISASVAADLRRAEACRAEASGTAAVVPVCCARRRGATRLPSSVGFCSESVHGGGGGGSRYRLKQEVCVTCRRYNPRKRGGSCTSRARPPFRQRYLAARLWLAALCLCSRQQTFQIFMAHIHGPEGLLFAHKHTDTTPGSKQEGCV